MHKPSCDELTNTLKRVEIIKEQFDTALETLNLSKLKASKAEIYNITEGQCVFIDIEKAREILGSAHFFGPDQIEKEFGIKLDIEKMPRIPFDAEELDTARKLHLKLIYRPTASEAGALLTFNKIVEMHELKQEEALPIISPESIKDETYYNDQAVRAGWALVGSHDIVENVGLWEQTSTLSSFIEYNFPTLPLSDPDYSKMSEEVKNSESLFTSMQNEFLQNKDFLQLFSRASKKIVNMTINQKYRDTPAEFVYDLLLTLRRFNASSDAGTATNCLDSKGRLICLGISAGGNLKIFTLKTFAPESNISFNWIKENKNAQAKL
jgi:hypothetical protein